MSTTLTKKEKITTPKAAQETSGSVAPLSPSVQSPSVASASCTTAQTQRPAPNATQQAHYPTTPAYTPPEQKYEFTDQYDLPARYDTTNLTLMARDPNWIHAYWDISQESANQLKETLGSEMERSQLVLRMHDTTLQELDGSNANRSFDIDINQAQANNWNVDLWADHVSYCGELGMRTPDGRFYPLTRSNTVQTPPKNVSWRNDVIWMEAKGDRRAAFINLMQRRRLAPRSPKLKYPYSALSRREKRMYLTEDDIRAYYSRLFPLLRLVLAARKKKTKEIFDRDLEIFDRDLAGGLILQRQRALGQLLGVAHGKFFQRGLLGASQELTPGGGSELFSGGASERKPNQRKFFFEIGTELIVYGRTEADAEVRLGNKKIDLRPDGTFSLRFALPDGKIPLDFVAISNDKVDTRNISTSVERTKTRYNP